VRSLPPPRDLRLARAPLLVAYLLVLLGTPVGEAGFLWMHLTTAHTSPATPDAEPEHTDGVRSDETAPAASASEDEHDPLPAREHGHPHAAPHEHGPASEHAHGPAHAEYAPPRGHERAAAHGHPHAGSHDSPPAHHRAAEAQRRSFAPDEPHEHGGRVHTHQQHPVPDAELLTDALSKFYLSPPTTSAPSPGADSRQAAQVPPALHQVAVRIDTPPPRLPG
jgi:hypothetical protein